MGAVVGDVYLDAPLLVWFECSFGWFWFWFEWGWGFLEGFVPLLGGGLGLVCGGDVFVGVVCELLAVLFVVGELLDVVLEFGWGVC